MGSSPTAPTNLMKNITILLLTTTVINAQRPGPPPHSRMLVKPPLVQAAAKPSPLESTKVQDKLLSLFKSSTKSQRLVGYKAVRGRFESGELKSEDRRLYRVLIGKAEKYHVQELQSHIGRVTSISSLSRDNGTGMFKTFNDLYSKWYLSALNSQRMCRLDWRKPQHEWDGTHQKMEKEIKVCSELFIRLTASWERIKASGDCRALYETCEAINECRAEASWCDGEVEFEEVPLNKMVTSIPAGISLKKSLQRIDSFDMMIERYTATAAFNKKQLLDSAGARGMVKLLNERRLRLGLECFKLDELLSKVCKDHSHDMVDRQFFSHKGSDGKEYRARVLDADWYGSPLGELLYSGSTVPRDVHTTWWKSEDNRPKLYASHLNRIGIGIVDKTWTVIVGRTYERSLKRYRIAE